MEKKLCYFILTMSFRSFSTAIKRSMILKALYAMCDNSNTDQGRKLVKNISCGWIKDSALSTPDAEFGTVVHAFQKLVKAYGRSDKTKEKLFGYTSSNHNTSSNHYTSSAWLTYLWYHVGHENNVVWIFLLSADNHRDQLIPAAVAYKLITTVEVKPTQRNVAVTPLRRDPNKMYIGDGIYMDKRTLNLDPVTILNNSFKFDPHGLLREIKLKESTRKGDIRYEIPIVLAHLRYTVMKPSVEMKNDLRDLYGL